MDPLSALRLAASPDLRAPRMPKGLEEILGKQIPLSELEKLTPAAQMQPQFGAASGGSFSNVLGELVDGVNSKQAAAGEAVNGLLTGQNVPLHQAMIAMEEASVSFQLMVEVRNKLLESYQELMRMQV